MRGCRLSRRNSGTRRGEFRGFTLLEVLIALTITMILMTLVVQVFQFMSDGVFHSRATMELADQLRHAKHRLIQDLRGTTALTIPPAQHTWNTGYFEYFEGDSVAVSPGGDIGFRPAGVIGSDGTNQIAFTEYGDRDDILAFTTANFDGDFIGRMTLAGQVRARRSKFAEVCWYPRVIQDEANATQQLMTLRRKQMIITKLPTTGTSSRWDVSGRILPGNSIVTQYLRPSSITTGIWVGNNLESLAKRENRIFHNISMTPVSAGGYGNIPTSFNWFLTAQRGIALGGTAPFAFQSLSLTTANEVESTREAEDVILTSIVGFDVKAWDPGAPVYRVPGDPDNSQIVGCVTPGDPGYLPAVKRFLAAPKTPANMPVSFGAYADLNFLGNLASQTSFTFNVHHADFPVNKYYTALAEMSKVVKGTYKMPYFAGPGDATSRLAALRDTTYIWTGSTYDTFSRHYEYDGFPAFSLTGSLPVNITHTSKRIFDATKLTSGAIMIDAGKNGIDDNGNGLIDEPYERDAPPPYEKPLRGIRVNIRAIEPDSKTVRQVTVVHEFIPH